MQSMKIIPYNQEDNRLCALLILQFDLNLLMFNC